MNRKKAMILLAIIETVLFVLVDVLYSFEKISLTGLIISIAVLLLVTMGLAFTIRRKMD